ncbi:hypothetical protein KY321_02270 [Candidatus Woesearchaeota archaeon]|nr:hypothetical protein [Candidatus Woesearchaeota archaeon]
MKNRNIVFGALFLLGGYWLFKNFLNKKVQAEKPTIKLPETSEEEKKMLSAREDIYKWDMDFGACFRQIKGIGGCGNPLGNNIKINWSEKSFELTPEQQKLINEAIKKSKIQNR